eukprot:10523988-Prorocentrum_lima.AAC.1
MCIRDRHWYVDGLGLPDGDSPPERSIAAGSPCGCTPQPVSQQSPLCCGYQGSVGTGWVLKSSRRRGNGDQRE